MNPTATEKRRADERRARNRAARSRAYEALQEGDVLYVERDGRGSADRYQLVIARPDGDLGVQGVLGNIEQSPLPTDRESWFVVGSIDMGRLREANFAARYPVWATDVAARVARKHRDR